MGGSNILFSIIEKIRYVCYTQTTGQCQNARIYISMSQLSWRSTPGRKNISVKILMYSRGHNLFEFLSIAGRCKKSHRFAAYIVGCITAIVITALILVFAYKILSELTQYEDFSINLFNLVEIEASR